MVNLTRIYTRTGDDGTTSLGDFGRTPKTDPRLVAYADTNEANAQIGVALATGDLGDEVSQTLTRIQNELFDVGADLCNPLKESYEYEPLRVGAEWIADLETDCDTYLERVEPLRSSPRSRNTAMPTARMTATTTIHKVGLSNTP